MDNLSNQFSSDKDFLETHGMSKASQYAATVRAANVPVSDFEGEYESQGTYTSAAAQMLQKATQHRAREVKVKKAYGK
jgi:hypothetical protein